MADFRTDSRTFTDLDEDDDPLWGARGLWLGRPPHQNGESTESENSRVAGLSEDQEEERGGRRATTNDPYPGYDDEGSFYAMEMAEDDDQEAAGNFTKSPARLARRTSSRAFRDLIARTYPGLGKSRAYWTLMQYLIYGTTVEKDTGHKLITREMVAEMEGKAHLLSHENYSARRFLDAFSRDVVHIHYSGWSYSQRRARVIEGVDFSPEIQDAIHNELLGVEWRNADRVYFVDGKKFNRATQAKIREEDRVEALERLSEAGCAEARDLLEYMNGLPPNRFHKMLAHIDDGVLEAFKIVNEDVRDRQMSILRAIVDQPLPLYKPVSRSPRIFAFNECLLLLKREVRAALCQDWTGFDLRSAQLAIVAKDWNVPEVQAFLVHCKDTRLSVWTTLASEIQFELGGAGEIKDVLKTATYTIVFGGGRQRLVQVFEDGGLTEEDARRFLDHPVIVAMLRARSKRVHQIRKAGGEQDCFGRWIGIPHDKTGPNPRSVLAQLAQARELQLLYPVVELALATDEFVITVWLHDGFYVDFKDASKKARWMKRITEVVNNRARDLGIATELELKK